MHNYHNNAHQTDCLENHSPSHSWDKIVVKEMNMPNQAVTYPSFCQNFSLVLFHKVQSRCSKHVTLRRTGRGIKYLTNTKDFVRE